MPMNRLLHISALVTLAFLSTQCNPEAKNDKASPGNDSLIQHAELLSVIRHENYTDV